MAPWFPDGTVHVGVVDPGVGSDRRILAFASGESVFLAPDNGLIGYVLSRRQIDRVVEVKRRRFFLRPVSRTFHGRDVFAPVAAWLARGVAIDELGPAVDDYLREELPRPRCRRAEGAVTERGEVIDVDRFGNAMTNLRLRSGCRFVELRLGETRIRRLSRSYASVAAGELLAIVGSTGFIEVARSCGDAAATDGIGVGERCVVTWRERGPTARAGRP